MTQERNKPFTARSVLASALLGMDPPELPVSQLVRLTGLFGLSENRARVALSRMVTAGEATTDGQGRYRLAGHLAQRQARQTASRSGATTPWDGAWIMAVVTTSGSTAEVRSERRRSLAYARLAELREGVWMRPANLDMEIPTGLDQDLELMRVEPQEPQRLARQLWNLESWAAVATDLRRALSDLPPRGPEVLAPGFTLSASVLRHLQADPLLPAELHPASWPGGELRRDYDEWDAAYRAILAAWSHAPAPLAHME